MLPSPLVFDWSPERDPGFLRDREWLVTNGLGGYASGTLLGIGSRRYHGLFVPNLAEPKGRHIMISRFDEEIEVDGRYFRLGGAEFLDGRLETDVPHVLTRFSLDASMPTWRFALGSRVIDKTIVMPQYQNTVCVRYRLVEGPPITVRLRPFAAFRRQDALLMHEEDWPFVFSYSHGRHAIQRSDGHLTLRFGLRPSQGVFVCDAKVGRNVLYRVEQLRGYDHSENVFSPGYFAVELTTDTAVSFVATTQGWQALEIDGDAAIAAERQRVERLLAIAPPAAREGFAAHLTAAADQFIVLPGSRLEETLQAGAAGDEVRTVIAGYHWFGDWGRDTMISLEGLTLCTGRWREAAAILRTFSHYVRDGLLPNLFPEGAREALYHTVDATLWYFHAVDRYTRVTGDARVVRELYPVLRDIVAHHVRGTLFNIGVDPVDDLIHAGAPGYQLTWMDAKVGDWVVTPRRGKPVEIQALWHNALRLMAGWAPECGDAAAPYAERAARVAASFERRFWNPRAGHLNDVVDGEQGDDSSCRPNQVFAISLPHPVLARAHWESVLEVVRARLLTPYGLRTLSPDHPDYKATYHGDLRARDAAYHQGTVWPWLMGHYVDAVQKCDPSGTGSPLRAFEDHLRDAGVGSISEIFDAEAPFLPRGCIAQAWSVAEVLRAWLATSGAQDAQDARDARAASVPAD